MILQMKIFKQFLIYKQTNAGGPRTTTMKIFLNLKTGFYQENWNESIYIEGKEVTFNRNMRQFFTPFKDVTTPEELSRTLDITSLFRSRAMYIDKGDSYFIIKK